MDDIWAKYHEHKRHQDQDGQHPCDRIGEVVGSCLAAQDPFAERLQIVLEHMSPVQWHGRETIEKPYIEIQPANP